MVLLNYSCIYLKEYKLSNLHFALIFYNLQADIFKLTEVFHSDSVLYKFENDKKLIREG